jgi:hypothetical protein
MEAGHNRGLQNQYHLPRRGTDYKQRKNLKNVIKGGNMIAEIGIMIGFYILTRCCSFLGRPEPISVKVMATITTIVTFLMLCALVIQGLTSSAQLR